MTPYSEVFKRFERKVTDYDLDDLINDDKIEIEIGFLDSSISDFTDCKSDLSDRDDTLLTFNIVLSDDEIEILSLFMVKHWTSQYKNTQDLLEVILSPDSFKRFSPANQLVAVGKLYSDSIDEADLLVSKYIYDDDFIGRLG
jgi:hypothetical protein